MHIDQSSASPDFKVPPHNNPYFFQLGREVTTLAAHINSAQCEWLMLVAEFDRVDAYQMDCGVASTADWLAWKCRLGPGTAREKVRVARALLDLPEIRAAFAAGELSYSMVRELTRVATPAREASLLNVCRHGTASHVQRLVRHVRRIDRQADPEESFKALEQRRASWWTCDDDMVEVRMMLAPDQGRTVVAVLDALVEQIKNEIHEEEDCSIDQRRADAVERLAEMALAFEANEAHRLERDVKQRAKQQPGQQDEQRNKKIQHEHDQESCKADIGSDNHNCHASECATNRTSAAKRITGGDLTTLNVNVKHEHIDLEQLVPLVSSESDGSNHVNQIDGVGHHVPRGALSRLSCDCALVATINDADDKPLGVGRKTRVVPPALRRALERRDLGCTFPGCSHHRHVDAHHITHWAHGGETTLENLTLLCRRHHRLVHEGGFTVSMSGDGRPVFITPRGARVEPAPSVDVPAGTLADRNVLRGVALDHTTTQTLWDGREPDWGMMVDGVLMYH